ncbi:class Ib ribonucleoside-diphosphate reductase assembly flavoprotein NrdI [Mycolicibacterium sp. CBMA 295]|uniref:class Ib ribonucleoside-diphosphate reductase assembly flavoprotein NrdI n=1 Tax=Mycolicibacterium sp. CBMA 295 TaxID=2606605 RepID=UPI0012DF693A|nr:class Ib ribonucleoside-diphosphate reductase assembly flavoprotein NrdI [Mycolicibacterium sp. CBMA 295]MUM25858.1 class Ib ribonucleoside-diphosphate reductase assembly flavoprotein NrdI [Mycolicibacterium sp. CBMA 295]
MSHLVYFSSVSENTRRFVEKLKWPEDRVTRMFLNNEHNRSLIRGVIAAGNNNFGAEFAYAGNVVSRKCGVPYLYRFELMGTPDDVEAVRAGLEDFWKDQTCHQPSQLQSL